MKKQQQHSNALGTEVKQMNPPPPPPRRRKVINGMFDNQHSFPCKIYQNFISIKVDSVNRVSNIKVLNGTVVVTLQFVTKLAFN